MPAEAERGAHRAVQTGGFGNLGHHLNRYTRVLRLQVHRCRHQLVLKGEDGEDSLHAAGGAKRVPGHGLGGRHQRVISQDAMQHSGFHQIVHDRRRAVRVDVLDVARSHIGVGQRGAQCQLDAGFARGDGGRSIAG